MQEHWHRRAISSGNPHHKDSIQKNYHELFQVYNPVLILTIVDIKLTGVCFEAI